MKINDPVIIGTNSISIEDVIAVSRQERAVVLSEAPEFVTPIQRGRQTLERHWKEEQTVYGVTTGVGDSCEQVVAADRSDDFAVHLMRFHGCGLGAYLDAATCRAILVVRLASLKTGYSAVRYELLDALTSLLRHNVIPRIPCEGSVGASGDLTPLSYVAATLCGEREVYYNGGISDARTALQAEGLQPITLKAKEALAIMNGTSVMTAIAALAFQRARHILNVGCELTALLTLSMQLNKAHFDPRLFQQKPHPGQLDAAAHIAASLGYTSTYRYTGRHRVQATYAIRCAPHILGVLADCLPWIRQFITTEINSVNDNPLVDPYAPSGASDILHGGNFYGGHIAMAMDSLKNAVANCADLFDRQMALLVNERRNNGLPANLSAAPTKDRSIHHGFKAVHIATSAMAAEALKAAIPASLFSRSTESHNQDKVSMGTIAARDCCRVLDLTEQTLACTLAGACQALELRISTNELSWDAIEPPVRQLFQRVRDCTAFVTADRALETELRDLTKTLAEGRLD